LAYFSLDFFGRFLKNLFDVYVTFIENLSKASFSQRQGCHRIGLVEKRVYLLEGNENRFMRIKS